MICTAIPSRKQLRWLQNVKRSSVKVVLVVLQWNHHSPRKVAKKLTCVFSTVTIFLIWKRLNLSISLRGDCARNIRLHKLLLMPHFFKKGSIRLHVLQDMIFVQKFTLPDFQAKNLTLQKCVICDIFLAN